MNLTSTGKPLFFLSSLPLSALHLTAFPLEEGSHFYAASTTIPITGCITVHCKYLFPLLQEALKSEGAILNRVTAQNPVQHLAHSTLCSSDE